MAAHPGDAERKKRSEVSDEKRCIDLGSVLDFPGFVLLTRDL
jgi:hypothetical protein